MASGRRSSVKGAASYRRLLKQLPDSAKDQLKQLLQQAGPKLASDMKGRVPVLASLRKNRTPGALRNAITFRVTPATLNLKVGLLNLRGGRADLFYGHILDVGRKAGTKAVTRGPRAGMTARWTRLTPLYLVSQGMRDFRAQFLPDYRKLTNAILLDAARGAGDD